MVSAGAGGLIAWSALATAGGWGAFFAGLVMETVALAVALNLALASLAARWRALTKGGALAGLVVGSLVFIVLGFRGWSLLASFVAVGVGAAAVVAAVAMGTGMLDAASAVLVIGAGALGSLVDSVLGATVERRALLGNDGVNFLATLCGASFASGGSFFL
jgi:uncharacterized membrane protein